MFQIGNEYEQYVIDTRYTSIDFLSKYLKSKSLLKIGHNLKFDAQLLLKDKLVLNHIYDTMVVDYLLYNGKKVTHSLAACSIRYLDIDIDSNQLDLFQPSVNKSIRDTFKHVTFEDFTPEQVIYAAKDVEITCRIRNAQLPMLIRDKMTKLADLENEFALVLADMEFNGIPANVDNWLKQLEKASASVVDLENQLSESVKEIATELNWNSSKQVIKVFNALGIPTKIIDKEKSRKLQIQVFKDSVQSLNIKKKAHKFPIVDTYLLYKEYKKIITSYGIKFLQHINPCTNRIHSNFLQLLNTGRTASSNPNVQQIPRESPNSKMKFRSCIEAPSDNVFVIADYTSQELVVAANKAKEENMLKVFRENGDLHKATGAALYDKKLESVTKEERQNGKTVNFLMLFGGGEDKLSDSFDIPKAKAKILIQKYFAAFPSLKEFQEESFADTIKNGYISIDKLGRRWYMPEHEQLVECKRLMSTLGRNCPNIVIKHYNYHANEMFRLSANAPIQGEAASISKLACVLLRRIQLQNHKFKILLLVHDEIVVECKEEDGEEVKLIVEACMKKAADRFCKSVGIQAEAIISKKWTK